MSTSGALAPQSRGARAGRSLASLIVLSAVLGVVAGVLWVVLAPRPAFLVGRTGLYYRSSLPNEYVAMDGWFAMLTAAAGVIVAVVVLRRTQPGVRVVTAVAVTGLLGALIAWGTGHVLQPDKPSFGGSELIGVVKYGPMAITAKGVLVAWPIASLAILIFALAWQNPPESVRGDGQVGEVGPGQ